MQIDPNYHSFMTINATWFCPVRCSYCYLTKLGINKTDRTILPEETLRKQLQDAVEIGVKDFRISGGEPITAGSHLFRIADLILEMTGIKPHLLTSGLGLNGEWIKRAAGKFCGIYISVENPLSPYQTVVKAQAMLKLIREYAGNEDVPLKYGLTLIKAENFKDLSTLFDLFFENAQGRSLPQFGHPCHFGTFVPPTESQLLDLKNSTYAIFKKHHIVPYYFTDFVGPYTHIMSGKRNLNLNLSPYGFFTNGHSDLKEATMYAIEHFRADQLAKENSEICKNCEWNAVCNYILTYGEGKIPYEECGVRKAVFSGMHEALIAS